MKYKLVMQYCSKCKIEKEENDFRNRVFNIKHNICKICEAEYNKKYYLQNAVKIKKASTFYKRKNIEKVKWLSLKRYGCLISYEEFLIKWKAWDGKCQNTKCQEKFEKETDKPQRRLHCDHDHISGLFRGFLCEDCNHAEGQLKSVERAEGLVLYMKKYRPIIQWLECLSDKQDVLGSIPSGTTK